MPQCSKCLAADTNNQQTGHTLGGKNFTRRIFAMRAFHEEVIPEIRRLTETDLPGMKAHFLGLSKDQRRLRFGNAVNDEFLTQYAETIFRSVSLVYGAFIEDDLVGVAEIRGLPSSWTTMAEAAMSVEESWQNRGIGDALLQRLIATAQNRGVKQLCMICLKDNEKMQHLASKYEAILQYEVDHVEGRIHSLHPTFNSLFKEFSAEARSLMKAILTP